WLWHAFILHGLPEYEVEAGGIQAVFGIEVHAFRALSQIGSVMPRRGVGSSRAVRAARAARCGCRGWKGQRRGAQHLRYDGGVSPRLWPDLEDVRHRFLQPVIETEGFNSQDVLDGAEHVHGGVAGRDDLPLLHVRPDHIGDAAMSIHMVGTIL